MGASNPRATRGHFERNSFIETMGNSESEESKPDEPLKSGAVFGEQYVVPDGEKKMILHMTRDDGLLADANKYEVTDIANGNKVVMKAVGDAISDDFAWNQCNAVTDGDGNPLFIVKHGGLAGEEKGIYKTIVTGEKDEDGKKVVKEEHLFNIESNGLTRTAWAKYLKNIHGQEFALYSTFALGEWDCEGQIKLGNWGTDGEILVRCLTFKGVPEEFIQSKEEFWKSVNPENDYFLEIRPGMDYVVAVAYIMCYTRLQGKDLSSKKSPG